MELNKFSLTPILILKHSFYTLSLTLLSLLLPLSFLLLSKLTSSSSVPLPPPSPFVLGLLVSFISLSSLVYSLTGNVFKPTTPISWAVLITFQVLVTLGTESAISSATKKYYSLETSYAIWVERAVFSLGVYDTMLYWMRVFVKPVVGDAIYGFEEKDKRVDRMAIGVAFGGLWMSILRWEVEPLVFVGGKGGREVMEGWNQFVAWVVSYTTLVIGMVRIMEVTFWVGSWFFCCFWRRRGEVEDGVIDNVTNIADQV